MQEIGQVSLLGLFGPMIVIERASVASALRTMLGANLVESYQESVNICQNIIVVESHPRFSFHNWRYCCISKIELLGGFIFAQFLATRGESPPQAAARIFSS